MHWAKAPSAWRRLTLRAYWLIVLSSIPNIPLSRHRDKGIRCFHNTKNRFENIFD